ncbi:MAG TPA: hypothetical protein VIX86_11655, partial [Streptosporangiaceae bacterium]
NGLDGWTCTIFHREGPGPLASDMICDAEDAISLYGYDCGPDGLLSYVGDGKMGYCFRRAGYRRRGLSADGAKILLHKPYLWERYPGPLQGVLL